MTLTFNTHIPSYIQLERPVKNDAGQLSLDEESKKEA